MKLRNKKTGIIVDVESLGHADSLKGENGYQVTLSWSTEYDNLTQCKDYNSLAELNEDWEDYVPKEPLIKDEKIRKAVRAWAEANSLTYVRYKSEDLGDRFNGFDFEYICFNPWKADNLKEYHDYSIEELCGSEE